MTFPGVAGPSQPITLSGTEVGQLDPTQGSRILRTPGARLSFASYDPFTASIDRRNMSAQDRLSIAKRIVIETLPNGTSTWRWVPRAKGVENIGDEGRWPRIVEICGQQILCSQDQWNIYKLDPGYDCVVHPSPLLSTITRRENARNSRSGDLHAKRRVEGVISDDEDDDAPSHKRTRTANAKDAEEDLDSDDEVEELIDNGVDDHLDHERKQQTRERRRKLWEERSRRRRKLKSQQERQSEPRVEDVSMIDLTLEDNLPSQPQPHSAHDASTDAPQQEAIATCATSTDVPPTMPGGWGEPTWAERTSSGSGSNAGAWSNTSSQTSWEESTQSSSQPDKAVPQPSNYAPIITIPSSFKRMKRTVEPPSGPPSKRPRVVGPSSGRRDAHRQKSEKRAKIGPISFMNAGDASGIDGWRFMADIHFSKTTSTPPGAANDDAGKATRSRSPDDVDPVSLEEKIERMRELNAFEDARRRAAQAEEEKRKAEEAEAAKKRKQEEEMRLRREREERERREREQEQERRRREQEEKAERIRKQKLAEEEMRRQLARLAHGAWTTQRALEHYKLLSDRFDHTQFTVDNPLTFLAVPWPVLVRPMQYSIEDIEWGAVEEFFKAVRLHMRAQEYKTFMEQTHRRFHPDRWRAKRILQSVEDENLRSCLEVADNVVSQAVTPLWLASKQS